MNLASRPKLILEHGLRQMGMNLLVEPLFNYLTLLHKWNATYNLVGARDLETIVSKHILDSLAIAPWLQGKMILDVGTGAGFPGIPLSIAFPELQWVLLDSNGKKIRFLTEVKRQLKLTQVQIVEQRLECYQANQEFDTVLSRAFCSIEHMLKQSKHLIVQDGLWLMMKGIHPHNELSKISQPYQVRDYTVEGIEGKRCLVLIKNDTKEQS